MSITVTTLQEGCKALGIETNSKKAKELESLIDKALKSQELGYECPSCKKDIPDVKVCPYCGESFEESDDVIPANEEELEKTIEDAAEEIAENLSDDKNPESEAEDKKSDKKSSDKKSDKKKDDKKDAKSDKKDATKDAKEDKKDSKKGRPAGPVIDMDKKNAEFKTLVDGIDAIVKDSKLEKREKKTGITYFKDGKRFMKAISVGKTIIVEFNANVDSTGDGVTSYTEEEAKKKHLGTTRAVYSGGDIDTALKLTSEALGNFGK